MRDGKSAKEGNIMEEVLVGRAENGTNGQMLLRIAASLGLGVVVISVLCACLGGVRAEGIKIGTFEFLYFGSGSTWNTLIKAIGEKAENAPYFSTFIQYSLGLLAVVAMLVTLLVMLILSVVAFVRGWKTGELGKACKNAYGAYAAFLGGQAAILSLFSGTKLNAAALVGAVLAGLMVCAMVVLRLVAQGERTFTEQKSCVHVVLVMCEMLFTVLTLAFAGSPLLESEGKMNFIDYLRTADAAASLAGHAIGAEVMLSSVFGAVVTVVLSLSCALLLVKCCNELSCPDTAARGYRRAMWCADMVAACVLGVIAIAAIWIGAPFGSVAQIVIIVSAVAVYGIATGDYFVLKKMQGTFLDQNN